MLFWCAPWSGLWERRIVSTLLSLLANTMANHSRVEVHVSLSRDEAHALRFARTSSERVQAIVVPRHKLDELSKYDDRKHFAVYFLFDESRTDVYIGQAIKPRKRIYEQYRKKQFWTTAVVMMSNTAQSFTGEMIDWLEWHCARTAHSAGRCHVKGEKYPDNPDAITGGDEIFSDIATILSVLGFPVFDPEDTPDTDLTNGTLAASISNVVFRCRGKDAEATGTPAERGFLVRKGSLARKHIAPASRKTVGRVQKQLLDEGVLVEEGEAKLRFTKDFKFLSSSGAASLVLGHIACGPLEWKNEDRKSLREIMQP